MPTLYVVATPIGNLEDMTLRAIRTLKEVDLIAAEDTRKTRHLLAMHGVATPVTSYHEQNKRTKLGTLLDLLKDKDLALVSEAGMPGLSDPGFELISSAIALRFAVVPVPGPSVVLTALVVSGLPVNQFTYLGFLPRRPAERLRMLSSVAGEPRTLVFFEAPHRLRAALQDMERALGNRRLAACRELTKVHEEVFRGTLQEALDHFVEPRGEFTLVVEGALHVPPPGKETHDEAKRQVLELRRGGMRLKEAVACVAVRLGMPKKALYDLCKGNLVE